MSDYERLLAQCLREKEGSYTIKALVAEYPSYRDLLDACPEELASIDGVGAAKARQVTALAEFVRQAYSTSGKHIIQTPQDVFDIVRAGLEYLQVERFEVMGLSTKNVVLFRHVVSIGSIDASVVHPREVFKVLVKRSCTSCILAHNHPSGDPTPSQADITLTKQLIEAGRILGIEVLDHVVVGLGTFYTFKGQGLV